MFQDRETHICLSQKLRKFQTQQYSSIPLWHTDKQIKSILFLTTTIMQTIFCSILCNKKRHLSITKIVKISEITTCSGFQQCLYTYDFQWNRGPTSGTAVKLKTGRREVPGSNLGRACRPSRSEFSVVFSETRLNTS